jgi:hypothetical protein
MHSSTNNSMESLLEWGKICLEFGCSEDQLRELFSTPCPEFASATESYEDVLDAFRQESDLQQPLPEFRENRMQN